MMRLALPKGRNLRVALDALRDVGVQLGDLETGDRRLRVSLPEAGMEALLLKDWDVPRYVEYGVADYGVVGSDVLEEIGSDLLVPVRFTEGTSRLSLIGHAGGEPEAGRHVRLATKYPRTARRMLADRPWSAEVLPLSGSIELAPLLDLAEVALDIVQTGRTLRDNGLVELDPVRDVAACVVVNRAAYQRHRGRLNDWIDRLETAGHVAA